MNKFILFSLKISHFFFCFYFLGNTHVLPNLTNASALPSGPIPLSVSSKALASKEFSYIVQRAQIQQRKHAKQQRRLKRQRTLEAAAARAVAMTELEQQEQGQGQEQDSIDMGGLNNEEINQLDQEQSIAMGEGDGSSEGNEGNNEGNEGGDGELNDFGGYDDMDWGAQDNMDDYNYGDNNDEDGRRNSSMSSAQSPTNDTSYSQLCRAHVAAYMRGTHQYAQETNLTRRVTAWEDKLLPVLDDQFRRPQFDIHDCGAQLLDTLSLEVAKNVNEQSATVEEEEDNHVSGMTMTEEDELNELKELNIMAPQFIQLAKKQKSTRYEVCRLFLSMLQLANDRNVELMHDTVDSLPKEMIMHTAAADYLTDSLRVKLLSTHKAVEFHSSSGFNVKEDMVTKSTNKKKTSAGKTKSKPLGKVDGNTLAMVK